MLALNIGNVALELLKTGLSLLMLLLSWSVGQRIVSHWEMLRKNREADLALSATFQELIGEFKETWRLWKVFTSPPVAMTIPDSSRWELLERASEAEGKLEAIFIKLAIERELDDIEIKDLGIFRQAYQQLRQGIRENQEMRWDYKDPEYRLINKLGARVAHYLAASRSGGRPSSRRAESNLERIFAYRMEHWAACVKELPPYDQDKFAPLPDGRTPALPSA